MIEASGGSPSLARRASVVLAAHSVAEVMVDATIPPFHHSTIPSLHPRYFRLGIFARMNSRITAITTSTTHGRGGHSTARHPGRVRTIPARMIPSDRCLIGPDYFDFAGKAVGLDCDSLVCRASSVWVKPLRSVQNVPSPA